MDENRKTGLKHPKLWRAVSYGSAAFVGLILLVSGILKSMDLDQFIQQIFDYQIFTNYQLIAVAAWTFIVVEIVLGTALILAYQPKTSLFFSGILMLIFMAATGWAWMLSTAKDCGCFGDWLERTPKEALLEDIVILALIIVSGIGFHKLELKQRKYKAPVVVLSLFISLLLPVVNGYSVSKLKNVPMRYVELHFHEDEVIGLNGIDLNQGTYIVVLLDAFNRDSHDFIPDLNILAEDRDLPEIVGLSLNEIEHLDVFVTEDWALFPIGQVSPDIFWRLLGDGEVPRILVLKDGRMIRAWNNEIPNKEILLMECNLTQCSGGGGE